MHETKRITLKRKCSKITSIGQLKPVIAKELNIKVSDIRSLQTDSNKIMVDNKTLNDYNIIDSKHLSKLKYNVKDTILVMNNNDDEFSKRVSHVPR